MSAANPRFYKWYPTEVTDLGTMPFEGDFTSDDQILEPNDTVTKVYTYNTNTNEFGTFVKRKVGPRIQTVWESGVTVAPHYTEIDGQQVQFPVWFCYCGDGVCTVKVPNGEVEPVEVT